jgi:hypothetical protein
MRTFTLASNPHEDLHLGVEPVGVEPVGVEPVGLAGRVRR